MALTITGASVDFSIGTDITSYTSTVATESIDLVSSHDGLDCYRAELTGPTFEGLRFGVASVLVLHDTNNDTLEIQAHCQGEAHTFSGDVDKTTTTVSAVGYVDFSLDASGNVTLTTQQGTHEATYEIDTVAITPAAVTNSPRHTTTQAIASGSHRVEFDLSNAAVTHLLGIGSFAF